MDALLHNQIATTAFIDSAGKFLTINLGKLDHVKTEISIINFEGSKIHHTKANGYSILKINTKNLPKGYYLLQVTSNKEVINKKLVID